MKKIFLTGASSGIGKAIAIALAEEGHQVWGTSREIAPSGADGGRSSRGEPDRRRGPCGAGATTT